MDAYLTIALSFLMGLSIFLSWPLVFHKKMDARRIVVFNAVAIGILVFLLMDIFGDVAAVFGDGKIDSPMLLIFLGGFVAAFLVFMHTGGHRDPERHPRKTSMVAALGIGLQNLTEGLVFGSAGVAGLGSIYLLSLIGFTLQNMTEGFLIAAPLAGLGKKVDRKFLAGTFLVAALPTVLGTAIGMAFFSNAFIVFFDALASAAILYVVLVMFHVNIKKSLADGGKDADHIVWLTYLSILAGFAGAFVTNYI